VAQIPGINIIPDINTNSSLQSGSGDPKSRDRNGNSHNNNNNTTAAVAKGDEGGLRRGPAGDGRPVRQPSQVNPEITLPRVSNRYLFNLPYS
jgi:hypothetical protein